MDVADALLAPAGRDPHAGAHAQLVAGEVTTWAWVSHPHEKHPLDRPFAWALIGLDGADTALLHVVDAGDESRMRTGMRVTPRWRDERVGDIHDVEAFMPEDE